MIKPDGDHEILPANDAIKRANGMGLDLVEVAPNADPPVCRVLDYKKYVYEKKKKEKEAKKKQHTVDIKELRFRPHTDDHDYDFKMKHAEGFLKDGNKVKPKRGVSKPELANDKTPAKEAASEVAAPEVPLPTSFNVSDGNWFQIRGAIKEALNVDDLPKSKAGVIEYLESRGFEVIE